jgi:methionyl-tRNA formyltransferase
VADVAARYGLDVRQPASLRDPAFLQWLREVAPDLVVVVAYGRFIPKEVLEVPRLGAVNLHPSLLPRYRGPAPIPRAIAAGETETGVTVLEVTEELDAGDIILQRAVPIGPEDTSGSLAARLAEEGASLLAEALPLLETGRAVRRPRIRRRRPTRPSSRARRDASGGGTPRPASRTSCAPSTPGRAPTRCATGSGS